MEFSKFIEWSFYAIIGGATIKIVDILKSLKDSIETLNERVAVIIEKTTWHEKLLDEHEKKIQNIESKQRGKK